jgi:formylglycine-generating enzyme required for sulfatase activity
MRTTIALAFILSLANIAIAQERDFKVLLYQESDREEFNKHAIAFLRARNFSIDVTGQPLSDSLLANYQVVMWTGAGPNSKNERRAFEKYMENGGGWVGSFSAWRYDKGDNWPWFHQFMGTKGYVRCQPALPARLQVEDSGHPAMRNLPQYLLAPPNEWVQWSPDPGQSKDIRVMVTLAQTNYPLGITSIIKSGETPVVWTNTKYNMIYLGTGYEPGDRLQDQMLRDALMWVGTKSVTKGREAFAANQYLPEMIKVRGGSFMMGDDSGEKDEKPTREVTVSDFSIAKTETTRAQWKNFCLSTGREMPEDPWFPQSDQHPVVNISWDNAIAYCLWLSDVTGKHYRLPTEAEWEFAARGGMKSNGFLYSGAGNADSVAWVGRRTDGTMPVAQKTPNELGLYDMTGNVWEWTSDWYDASKEFYVLRGGAWDIGLRNSRVAYRNPLAPMSRNHNKGFRVVCD